MQAFNPIGPEGVRRDAQLSRAAIRLPARAQPGTMQQPGSGRREGVEPLGVRFVRVPVSVARPANRVPGSRRHPSCVCLGFPLGSELRSMWRRSQRR